MRGISIMAFLLAVALLIGAGCGGGSGTSSRPDGFYETSHPVFTPDGKGIVVAAVWHSRSTLFHMDLEGNNITRFLASSRPVTSPIFSPDGKSMAVVLPSTKPDRGAIAIADAQGRSLMVLTRPTGWFDRLPCFTADSRHIIFQRSEAYPFMQEFWSILSTRGEERRVADFVAWEPSVHGRLASKRDTIYFSQKIKLGTPDKPRFPYRLCHLNIKTGNLEHFDFAQPLVETGVLQNILFAPGGEVAAYVTPRDNDLLLIHADGRKIKKLGGPNLYPSSFSADGLLMTALRRRPSTTPDVPHQYDLVVFDMQEGQELRVIRPDWSSVGRR